MRLPAIYKDQKGVAAVEFAIVLPLLALILFGTIDFALLFYNKQVITNASRELARFAIVEDNWKGDAVPSIADQIDYIKEFCNKRLINLGGNNALTVEPKILTDDPEVNFVTARIEYNYDHLFSGILGINSTPLLGHTVMRNEQ